MVLRFDGRSKHVVHVGVKENFWKKEFHMTTAFDLNKYLSPTTDQITRCIPRLLPFSDLLYVQEVVTHFIW